jgi:hypothetical protein
MDDREKILFHQIHPIKLLTDGIAEVVSLPLFWQHRLRAALVVHFVPPVAASFAVMRWADLEPYRRSAFGRYIARSMTPRMQGLRLLGDLIMAAGAWRRRPLIIVAGGGLVLYGWTRGALLPPGVSSSTGGQPVMAWPMSASM